MPKNISFCLWGNGMEVENFFQIEDALNESTNWFFDDFAKPHLLISSFLASGTISATISYNQVNFKKNVLMLSLIAQKVLFSSKLLLNISRTYFKNYGNNKKFMVGNTDILLLFLLSNFFSSSKYLHSPHE